MSKRATKVVTGSRIGRTTKSFRLPVNLVDVLDKDAKAQGVNSTDLLISILTRYAKYTRYAEKFGMITVNRDSYRRLIEGLSDDEIRELATSRAAQLEEYVSFFLSEKSIDALLEAIDTISKYQWAFDYSIQRKEHELTIVIRTDLGRKFALYIGTAYQKGIAKLLGVSPKTEIGENQVRLTLPT